MFSAYLTLQSKGLPFQKGVLSHIAVDFGDISLCQIDFKDLLVAFDM